MLKRNYFLEISKALPDFIHVDRDDMINWLECDMNQEGFEQLTETEIVDFHRKDKPLTSSQIDCRNESDDGDY